MKNQNQTILIIDDNITNLGVLAGFLKNSGHQIMIAKDGHDGIAKALAGIPDLILLDVQMPGIDGFETCRLLKSYPSTREIPILFTTSLHDVTDKLKGFSVGGVDYITKPLQEAEVLARVETHLRLYHLQKELEEHNRTLDEKVKSQIKEISDSQVATIVALARLAESRDYETGSHLERVGGCCRLLAKRLCEQKRHPEVCSSDMNILELASTLHDIGKVGISDAILKKPGPEKLTKDEFEVVKRHTIIGAETLEAVQKQYPHNTLINAGIIIARSHHERWDGKGYPDGLKGENIPVFARIAALADVYDALRSKRVYKPAMSHEDSCAIIYKGSGFEFDPLIVEAFREVNCIIQSFWDAKE
jgi:putative two-component system response regulator